MDTLFFLSLYDQKMYPWILLKEFCSSVTIPNVAAHCQRGWLKNATNLAVSGHKTHDDTRCEKLTEYNPVARALLLQK